uniref:cytochrome c oxidase subunit III n=1 Tax=Sternaspis sendalli TaxID=2607893 RepID=UPI00226CC615|nr:cytochrome c oxidase subunit III [Sternaspis sendalli]UZP47200.1 cytochrome c oxidase subunit 3 [Sternaspis sendalli]
MVQQPFHLVELSPWPLTGSISGLLLVSSIAFWFHGYGTLGFLFSFPLMILTMFQWWRDISREGTLLGHHTKKVVKGLQMGMILFILSEVMFFSGFFWAFFHSSLAPVPEIGCCWPPTGISPIYAFGVPLLNTAVLLASGVTVTWAHHSLLEGNRREAMQALTLTILLGVYFTYLQAGEYFEASFTIADSVFGTTFFVATGFHGLHVLIGSSFLIICLLRAYLHHFSPSHHFGFEAAAWYWHFVDVVWICLFLCIYWWGS